MKALDKKSQYQLVALVMIIAFAVYLFIHNQVKPAYLPMSALTEDALKQYEIVNRSGTKMDVCIQAGVVAASYLQSHDEENYKSWNLMKRLACNNAGVPLQ